MCSLYLYIECVLYALRQHQSLGIPCQLLKLVVDGLAETGDFEQKLERVLVIVLILLRNRYIYIYILYI